ncbi:alpha/beta fold hydrolase [Niveispirillum sp. KHB5.9]|uniref:alpha/beta fold hydrolase n=1 Tax=Niveispirillum sp. KHB5.9 TaxID=3400269 RepID=UPI003A8A46A5
MSSQTTPPIQVCDRMVPVADHNLFTRTWRPAAADSAAPTLLLFHDSLGCVELWRDFPERLAAGTGLPVLAYDRLGFGRSDAPPGRLTPDFVAAEGRETVPALLDALCIGPFLALGHSVGGGMAVGTAAALPGRCRAVITLAAQAFVEDRTLDGIRVAQAQFRDPAQVARLARYHGDKAAWVLSAWIDSWLDPAFAGWTLDESLSGVTCPLLALHGDGDEYGSTAHPDRIATPGRGRAVVLTGCGHVPHREHPDRVLAEIASFLG